MKKIVTLFCLLSVGYHGIAQTPTWEKQISCILFSHCTSCHNPNGLATFSLTTYTQAYNNRYSIVTDVINNKMPPYLPDVHYSHFTDERILSNSEINQIIQWVNADAPAGDTTHALPPPVYNSLQVIASPDFSARIPVFKVPVTGSDLYQAFVISNPSSSAQFITDVEVIPGNRNVVHHVLIFQDTSMIPVNEDSSFAGPGYVSFGGIGSPSGKMISAWAPGSGVYSLPSGMAIKLDSGSRIIIQIHYPVGAAGQIDSTRLNFKYGVNIPRIVKGSPFLSNSNMTNGPLFIPADSVKTFHSQYTVPNTVSVVSIAPHAHLLCKKFLVYGITPANDTIKLIKIDHWDYHWQGFHSFQQPVKIPAGTVLHGFTSYDNTVNNTENPNTPPKDVSLGEASTDEMLMIYFEYLPYQNGDENLIIDTTTHSLHYLNCVPEPFSSGMAERNLTRSDFDIYPNPASNELILISTAGLDFNIELMNPMGEIVSVSENNKRIDVSGLSSGIYFLKATCNQITINRKIIIQK